MGKKYFWLKLKEDFFEQDDIKMLNDIPNGKEYIIFYLKLLCKSLKNDGVLRYKNIIPYTSEMLAAITNTNIDIVKGAIKTFETINLIEILDDGALFLNDIQNMTGCVTEWAEKKQKQRLSQKNKDNVLGMSSKCPQDVPVMSGQCPTEIEKEIRYRESEIERKNIKKEISTETEALKEFESPTDFNDLKNRALDAVKNIREV